MQWYKRDPSAALTGMAVLTLEECGAYNIILDLLYARDGNLPDDDLAIAKIMRVYPKTWRRLRRRLMDLGKLYVHGGCLHNGRADNEIPYALGRIAQTKLAGIKSGEERRQRRKIRDQIGNNSDLISPNLIAFIKKSRT